MANKSIIVTLTEKNDSGPLYDLFYGTDGINYTASVDNPLLLPSQGSTFIAVVGNEATIYKLKSRGVCGTEFTFGAPASTPTPTPTATPLTGYCTTYNVRDQFGGYVYFTNCATGQPDFRLLNPGPSTFPICSRTYPTFETVYGQVVSVGGTCGSYLIPTATPTPSSSPTPTPTPTQTALVTPTPTPTPCQNIIEAIICGYDVSNSGIACSGGTQRTVYVTEIPIVGSVLYEDSQGCTPADPGYYAPISGETGNGSWFEVDQFGEILSSGNCGVGPTPTPPPIYDVGDRTTSGYPTFALACGDTCDTTLYSNKSAFAQVGAGNGTVIYTDTNGTRLQGGNTWFGITATTGTPTKTILVDNNGNVTDDRDCTTPTPTPTAGPTPTPTSTQVCLEFLVANRSFDELLTVEYTNCSTGTPEQLVVTPDSEIYVCSQTTPIRLDGPFSYEIYSVGLCPTPTPTPTTPGPTPTPTPTQIATCGFGTHDIAISGGGNGVFKAIWQGSGNAYLARNLVTLMTGVSSPLQNQVYGMSADRIYVYESLGGLVCTLYNTFNASVFWFYDGQEVVVQVDNSYPVYGVINSPDAFCYQRFVFPGPTPTPTSPPLGGGGGGGMETPGFA